MIRRHTRESGARTRSGQAEKDKTAQPARQERIAKVLARAGVASRREVERLIGLGKVAVNGRLLDTPATLVGKDDIVTVDGVPVNAPEPTRLWRYHKPTGLMTTHRDPQGRPTVFEHLPPGLPRVISVGRLDLNSEGLLLLTNDGALARALELPSSGLTRVYRARAHGQTSQQRLDRLRDGITVEGVRYGSIEAKLDKAQGANVWITLSLAEGKNREVRRVLEAIGLRVNRLIRLAYGPFQLGTLPSGAAEEVGPRVIRELLSEHIAPENLPTGDRTPGPPVAPGRRPVADKAGRGLSTDPLADPSRKPSRVRAARSAAEETLAAEPLRDARPPRRDEPRSGPRKPGWAKPGPAAGPRGPGRPREERGERPYKPRTGPRTEGEGRERPYRPREDRPREERGERPYKPRTGPRTEGEGRERPYRPREERGERPYKPRSGPRAEGEGGKRPYRPREDRPREDRPREERAERPYKPRSGPRAEGEGGKRPYRPREDRPREERGGAAKRGPGGAKRSFAGAKKGAGGPKRPFSGSRKGPGGPRKGPGGPGKGPRGPRS